MAKVLIKTSEGDIKVRLYDETPQHRDNFLKLAKEGYFDGTLFHRVIKDFMIQGGDPDSKGALKGKNLGTVEHVRGHLRTLHHTQLLLHILTLTLLQAHIEEPAI